MKYSLLTLALLSTGASACLENNGRFEKTSVNTDQGEVIVVNDKKTNLQWLHCPLGQTTEQCIGDAQEHTFKTYFHKDTATAAIAEFNGNFAEEQHWRLPHTMELGTITDYNCEFGTNLALFSMSVSSTEYRQMEGNLKAVRDSYAPLLQAIDDAKAAWQHDLEHNPEVIAIMAEIERLEALREKKPTRELALKIRAQWSKLYDKEELVVDGKVVMEDGKPVMVLKYPNYSAQGKAQWAFDKVYRKGDESQRLLSYEQEYQAVKVPMAQWFATTGGLGIKLQNSMNYSVHSGKEGWGLEQIHYFNGISMYLRLVREIPTAE
ncbi:DUF1566 domain-containing protein [Thaumasiovibrio subtropicus]|uniref:Lcl domain-containing protein n=1 Tax=Thaumasiovibrio subtropicus TaxID=1891207 RepID=UPI000B35DF1D|nr:DUF1566 domain-containing protein [Thaumasiovibrio subtropicus]